MLAAVHSRSLSYSIQFLYERDNQPVRGAAVGIASRSGRGWGADTWATTDSRGYATWRIPSYGDYRIATRVRGRRREVTVNVAYSYQTNRLWVLADGTLRLDRFVP